jgi:hypothetical protein
VVTSQSVPRPVAVVGVTVARPSSVTRVHNPTRPTADRAGIVENVPAASPNGDSTDIWVLLVIATIRSFHTRSRAFR